MRILYFYQYFSTSKGSWGTRVHDFTSQWVKQGHEVIVVTSIYSKSDLVASSFVEDKNIDGIQVKVLNILIDNKQSFITRIISFIKYAVVSSWYALTLKADVVVASSGPITVGIPGLIAHYLRRRKLVFEVRDLWPDGAIELGIVKNRLAIKLAYWFEKQCYKAADLIVTLSPGMKDHIIKKYQHQNIISVTNAANIELFTRQNVFPSHYPLLNQGKYVIYSGNIGKVNNSEWLLEIARDLKARNRPDIKILLVGDGQQKEELKKRAEAEGIKNFIVLSLIPKIELVPLVQYALAALVPLQPLKMLNTSSPNKFFEALAAGTPVIQTTTGWMQDFLNQHHIGFTVSPQNTNEVVDLLIELDKNSHIAQEMKERAKRIAASEFDKDILANKMLSAIESLKHN